MWNELRFCCAQTSLKTCEDSVLNLFYEEPEGDRWFPGDRYPRRVIRRILRGPAKTGGQERVFLNLCAGLDRIGVSYRVNDYKHIQRHPSELACIVGKPHLLDKIEWKNPILFGAAVFSHPLERPRLLLEIPNIRRILVPGEWMRRMWEPHYGDAVVAWPVGIDTHRWKPSPAGASADIVVYDKVRWEHDRYEKLLLQPIRNELKKRRLPFAEIRYGFYKEDDFHSLLQHSKAMIFICEHESQGIAYQQALAAGIPILAWDRGGICTDPTVLAQGVRFGPVSSVPYWDSRCGEKFRDPQEFPAALDLFLSGLEMQAFSPRDYILENLTLEKCARHYLQIADNVRG